MNPSHSASSLSAAAAGSSGAMEDPMREPWEKFRQAHPGIQQLDLLLPDLSGILRCKTVDVSKAASLFSEHGVFFPRSTVMLCSHGVSLPGTGRIVQAGEPDLYCFPLPGTLGVYTDTPETACVLVQMCESSLDPLGEPAPVDAPAEAALELPSLFPGARPYDGDARGQLARLVARLGALGYELQCSCELEFTLVQAEDQPGGLPAYALNPSSRAPDDTEHLLADAAMQDYRPFLEHLQKEAKNLALPLSGLSKESSTGQFEANLWHHGDLCRLGDETLLMKRMIKHIARQHGFLACFMAKPHHLWSGNGLHIHVSLWDKKTRHNLMQGWRRDALPLAMRRALWGLLDTMGENFLLFAHNSNAYKRFMDPLNFAPVRADYGFDNRFVAVRVPRTAGGDARLEFPSARGRRQSL